MQAVIDIGSAIAVVVAIFLAVGVSAGESDEFPDRRVGGGTRYVLENSGSPPDQFPGGTSGGGGR